jgi:hypothetical protein
MPQFHADRTLPRARTDGRKVIFVFGSNLAGRHGKGAAKVAHENFGARYGFSEGRTGNAYGIPTKSKKLEALPLEEIRASVKVFLAYAAANPGIDFFVTRIGCELAGYQDAQIAPMFRGAGANCSFANEWAAYLTAPPMA